MTPVTPSAPAVLLVPQLLAPQLFTAPTVKKPAAAVATATTTVIYWRLSPIKLAIPLKRSMPVWTWMLTLALIQSNE